MTEKDAKPSAAAPVALVTGAGRRIGKAVAERLAADGYRLLLHVHRSVEEAETTADALRAAGGEAVVLSADLRDTTALARMTDLAWGTFGRIDALINCAAIWQPKPLEQITAADVRQNFEVNTLATFLCCQQVGLRMVRQASGGAIVNFGDWAIERPYSDYAAYFASKGAIPTLTRTMAVELGRRNPRVRVNAILPGPTMLEGADISPAERQYVVDGTLVRRSGNGDDIAQAVVFLLQNTFVTGACLPVDGGRTVFDAGDRPDGSADAAPAK